jgi:hypothetical protein
VVIVIFVFTWDDPVEGGVIIDAHDAATGKGVYRLVVVPGPGIERVSFGATR